MKAITRNLNPLRNLFFSNLLLPLTLTGFILYGWGSAQAAGTASGTTISLGATADYQVGGVNMPQVNTASPAAFMVDTIIDLTVAESGSNYTVVTPGATGQVLVFTVENTGNATQDFALSSAVVSTGGDDPIDGGSNTVDFTASGLQLYVDGNGNGTYESGADTATYIDELAPDTTITVFVTATIPNTPAHNDVAACSLTATAHDGGTSSSLGALTTENASQANDTSLVAANADVVFGDGSGIIDNSTDGAYSAADAFLVTSATLTISKTSALISDPFNNTTNPKMIPGAVVEYTITVTNGSGVGVVDATGILVRDDLSAEIANIAFDTDAYGSGRGIQYAVNDGGYTALTNAADAPTDHGSFVSNIVSVGSINLSPGDHADIQFRVVIQ